MEAITNIDSTIQPETDQAYSETISQNEISVSQQEDLFRSQYGSFGSTIAVNKIAELAEKINAMPIGGKAVFSFGTAATIQLVVCKSTTGSLDVYFADMVGLAIAVAADTAITPFLMGGMAAVGIAGAPAMFLTYAVTSYVSYVITTETHNWGSYVANYKENFYIYHDIATNQDGLVIKYNTTNIESIKTQLNNSGFLGFEKDIDLIVEDSAGKRYEVVREDEYSKILTEMQRRGFIDPTYLGADIHELFKDNTGLESQWSDGYSSNIDRLWDRVNVFDNVTNKKYILLDREILFPINGDAAANEIHIDDVGRLSGGAAGNDIVIGGNGNDKIYGYNNIPALQVPASDNDFLVGGDGNDIIYGNIGNDTIYGGTPEYYLTLDGKAIIPEVSNDDGNDYLDGDAGNDYMIGGSGIDEMHGGADNDDVYGGLGNDSLYGDGGNDLLSGNDGNDKIYGGDGNDNIYGGIGNDIIFGDSEDLNASTGGADLIYGGDGNDFIFGGEGRNTLYGGAGDDTVLGGSGVDTIDGGSGNNNLQGGMGQDIYILGSGVPISYFDLNVDYKNSM